MQKTPQTPALPQKSQVRLAMLKPNALALALAKTQRAKTHRAKAKVAKETRWTKSSKSRSFCYSSCASRQLSLQKNPSRQRNL